MISSRYNMGGYSTAVGLGDSVADFTGTLIADGLDPNLAATAYSEAWQTDYRYYRSKGATAMDAWRMAEIANFDQQAAHIALDKGTPPALIMQARSVNLFQDNDAGVPESQYKVPQAIRNGADPVRTIQDALIALGVTPIFTGSLTTAGTTTPAVGTSVQTAIPASDPYWTTPSGNLPYTGIVKPVVDLPDTSTKFSMNTMLMFAGVAIAGVGLLSTQKKGRK